MCLAVAEAFSRRGQTCFKWNLLLVHFSCVHLNNATSAARASPFSGKAVTGHNTVHKLRLTAKLRLAPPSHQPPVGTEAALYKVPGPSTSPRCSLAVCLKCDPASMCDCSSLNLPLNSGLGGFFFKHRKELYSCVCPQWFIRWTTDNTQKLMSWVDVTTSAAMTHVRRIFDYNRHDSALISKYHSLLIMSKMKNVLG